MTDLKTIFQNKLTGQIVYGQEIETKYLTDFVASHLGHADAYIKVADEQDIQSCLKLCYEHKIPVVIRGAGTNLVGSTIPDGGIVLDVSALNKILEFDEQNMTVTVQPGVLLKDLIEYCQQRGFLYAPDPAEKNASIGGNVATNAGGMRAVKYGVTRNYVLALDLIKIDGSLIHVGAKTYKYATGLNLQQLIIGSEGTLGVISKITLRLLPLPEFTLNAVLAFNRLSDGIACVNKLLKAQLDPTAIEFVEKKVIAYAERFTHKDFPCPHAKAYLIVTLDGAQANVYERFEKLKQVAFANGVIEVLSLDNPQLSKQVWEVRDALARAVKATGVWEPVDIVVPIDKIASFVDYVNAISGHDYPNIVAFGHAGDGNVHLCILKEQITDEKWPQALDKTMQLLYHKAYALGGLLSAEHGIGKAKRAYFLQNTDPVLRQTMLNIKQAFDEHNLLNPHDGYAN